MGEQDKAGRSRKGKIEVVVEDAAIAEGATGDEDAEEEESESTRAADTIVLKDISVKNLGIELVEAVETDFEETIFAIGRISGIPSNHAVLSSRIPGRIVELNAIAGDLVTQDQILVRVESRQPGNPPPVIPLPAPISGIVLESHVRVGEPVEPDDYIGQAEITRATSIPIAAGENEYTRYGFRDMINVRAVDILQPDALVLGGVTEFMKIAALAQANDLDLAPHGNQEVHIHLVCAIPNGLILEYYADKFDAMHGNVFKDTLEIKDGYVYAPDRAGLGMELNSEFLAKYRVG